MLDAWSARLGVDPHLIRALAWMESGFQTRIVSSAGARGALRVGAGQEFQTTEEFLASIDENLQAAMANQ